jgi:peptidoglycan/LPS O-acetylase OafA/YrhL
VKDQRRGGAAQGTMTTTSPSGSPRILTTLQAGRGLAAVCVVLYHLEKTMSDAHYWNHDPAHHAFLFGYAGVEFFFVLSGFIILYVHQRDIGLPGRLGNYLRRRFCRIYPIHWTVIGLILIGYFLLPHRGAGQGANGWIVAQNAMLVHFGPVRWWSADVNGVSWTLFHEVLFYLMFGTLLLNRRLGWVVLALWMALSLLFYLHPRSLGVAYFCTPLHLLFGLGMLGAWLVRRSPHRNALAWSIAGSLLLLSAALWNDYGSVLTHSYVCFVMFSAGGFLAIVGFSRLELSGKLRATPALLLIGDASYSIYLTHSQLNAVLGQFWLHTAVLRGLPESLSMLLIFLIVLALGIAFHLWVERPLLRVIGRPFKPAMQPVAA